MTKNKPTLVLDVDGVLADFVGATMQFLERNYGIYHDEPLKTWDFMDTPTLRPFRRVARGHWTTPGFVAGLQPIPGTIQVVNEARHLANVRFATSPMDSNPTWRAERNTWLAQHFGAQEGDVLHTVKKSEQPGHVFVDDKFENVVEYQLAHPAAFVYMQSRSYNSDAKWGGRRIEDLGEILSVLENLWKIFN